MTVRVKICGLTRRIDAEAAVAAGADLIGFIFVPGTPRALDPARVGWIRELRGAERVGVFRDAPLAEVERVRDLLALDRVQLHGCEPDAWLDRLGPATIRRVPVDRPHEVWTRVAELVGRCLPLVDPGAGSGASPDWEALGPPPPGLVFGLAGGLTAATVAAVVARFRPCLVDVSSGVESAPGVKDHDSIDAFITAARRRR